jgi:PIN domain nuclease of toxin-antitoxin system
MASVLLDTCAILYVANGDPLQPGAKRQVVLATRGDGVLVSPVSAWEIGLLAARKGIAFLPDPAMWFQTFLGRSGIRLTPLTPAMAIASSFLPPPIHGDPADRLLIATARALNVPIVTRDRLILAYATAGHVQAVSC